MKVSGHLLSTAEIESALVLHEDVVEAAVVGAPHPIKGHCPYAFVTLTNGKRLNEALVRDIKEIVRDKVKFRVFRKFISLKELIITLI